MKTKIALALFLGTAVAAAGETHFHFPTTDRAHQTQQLLSNAAHAVNASGSNVSNLWVFPTAQADTVFAQYVVNSKTSAGEQHLEVLRLKGNRVVSRRDLTREPI